MTSQVEQLSNAPRLVFLALMGLLIASDPANAAAGPLAVVGGHHLDVTANELKVDIEQNKAVLIGDVQANLGQLEVKCPRVEIAYDNAPQVRWAKGSGGVEARLQGIVAKADSVEVDVGARKVLLSGGVKLTRGRGWVSAERASIEIATQKVTLSEVKGSIPVKPPQR